MLKKNWKAFSWSEIAAALVIFAVIVGLTLPSFPKYRCLAKQSEAKYEVMRILAAAELYKSQKGQFPDLSELRKLQRIRIKEENYSYKILNEGGQFTILATGKKGSTVERDLWQVDQNRNLKNVVDACSK